jgi:hypothetical protein
MAFVKSRLKHLGQGVWFYKTDDTAATVDTDSYFNDKGSPLKLGDIIYRLTVTNIDLSNEAISTYGTHVVNAVTRARTDVIDVSDTTAGTVTDTD